MSGAIRGQAESPADPDSSGAPLAQVSRSSLLRNAALARAGGVSAYPASLLRADAWGHGAELVAGILEEAGFQPAPNISGALLEPAALFGLPGASTGEPAMRFSGTVLGTKELRTGEGVSYGYRYRAPADTRIALVTGGYAQGVVRSLGNAVDVTFRGLARPVVGRVAMDVCVVEIGAAEVRRGDRAVFFGDPHRGELSIEQWCAASGLSAAELVTAVGLHARREVGP